MHPARNERVAFAAVADQFLCETRMRGARLAAAAALIIHHGFHSSPYRRCLKDAGAADEFQRDASSSPLFAKPIGGNSNLAVVSASR